MSKSIPLSKNYGANPTIPICFWCGEEKNEIALLGKLKGDAEAPRKTWLLGDYEPCDKCKDHFGKGILIIEASTVPLIDKQPPYLQEDAYPTGNYVVLSEEGTRKIFTENVAEKLIEKKKGFMDEANFSNLFGNIGKED